MQPTPCTVQKIKDGMTDPGKPGAGSSSSGGTEPPRRSYGLPPEILNIIWPAVQIGGLSGMLLPCNPLLLDTKPLLNSMLPFPTRALTSNF